MGIAELTRFGDMVRETRLSRGLSMRQLAQKMGVSTPYLSDVEKGRRMAFTPEKMELFASIMEMDDRERDEMYELAAAARDELPADNIGYMKENPYVSLALRRMRRAGADRDDWAWMVDELLRRKGLK